MMQCLHSIRYTGWMIENSDTRNMETFKKLLVV
jgi:hypothetical protein